MAIRAVRRDAYAKGSAAWRWLALLFLVNLLNFYDRTISGIVSEPVRIEFGLSDSDLGLVAAAFAVVYAAASVPLGRLADTRSRSAVILLGLAGWSLATGSIGLAWSFAALVGLRMVVGMAEASFGPASLSLLGDLFPSGRRSMATGIYMLGLPAGLTLAFFTTGSLVAAFHTWRAPFLLSMIPGLGIGLCLWGMREPARGDADSVSAPAQPFKRPIRRVLGIATMWWITLAGIAANSATYATSSFLVPLLQRYYGLPLTRAATLTGVVLGLTGILGLPAGG